MVLESTRAVDMGTRGILPYRPQVGWDDDKARM